MATDGRFEEFVRTRAHALYRYGYLLTGNAHDTDDLVQDALLKVRAAWSRLGNQDDPIGYTRTVMARLHINSWRRRRREYVVPDVPDTAVDEGHGTGGQYTPVWRALATLAPGQRAVLVLRYYEQLSDVEIAATLGVSPGTVRSQMFRALANLRATPRRDMIMGDS
jgi:RNA polymerase sigma-70 factor (sigma-E family)